MKVILAFLLTAVMAGCGHVPRAQILDRLGYNEPLPANPIPLYVAEEVDIGGTGYRASLDFYALTPLHEEIKYLLLSDASVGQPRRFKVTTKSMDSRRKGFTATITNPFVIVEDSLQAEVMVRLGVRVFDHRAKWESGDRLFSVGVLGPLGLLLSRGNSAALIAEAKIENVGTRETVYEFTFAGVKSTQKRGLGLKYATILAAEDFVNTLLQHEK